MTGLDEAARTRLAGQIDQLIGWAKAGKTHDYYLMDRENVDLLRDHVLAAVAGVLEDPEG